MCYQLAKLDAMVGMLQSYQRGDNDYHASGYRQLQKQLESVIQEAEQARLNMMDQLFTATDKHALGVLVENYQVACIALADRIFEQRCSIYDLPLNEHSLAEIDRFCEKVLFHIESLLQFIETYFAAYFSLTLPLPKHYYIRCRHKIHSSTLRLKRKLSASERNCPFIQLVLTAFTSFSNGSGDECYSYGNYFYLKCLANILDGFGFEQAAGQIIPPFARLLVACDFNVTAFANLFMEKVGYAIRAKANDSPEQMVLWKQVYKEVSLTLKQINLSYNMHERGIKETLLELIEAEISLSYPNHPICASNVMQSRDSNTESLAKPIHVGISVSQIAILLRVFVESGVIKTPNQTELLRKVCHFIRTDYAQEISAESLRNKYYAPDAGSLRFVKDLLFTMIKHMRKLEY